ncbi:MAG: hypothetical protein U5L76_00325 [Patescibacteria group bacterium]|nr:hypothetical protein [Patescibacteria group bacterium]
MKILESIKQDEVWEHWFKIEKPKEYKKIIDNGDNTELKKEIRCWRCDIKSLLPTNIKWSKAKLENNDIEKIFIISSSDWRLDKLCIPDYKLTSAIINYRKKFSTAGKFKNIHEKENLFLSSPNVLDTKLIFISEKISGLFTIIEGNKRAVALGKLDKMKGLEIFLGISPEIKDSTWARYSYNIK